MQAPSKSRSNRVLLALAAAWMIIALAIGAPASADVPADDAPIPAAAQQ